MVGRESIVLALLPTYARIDHRDLPTTGSDAYSSGVEQRGLGKVLVMLSG
jgi:hypothetical protein